MNLYPNIILNNVREITFELLEQNKIKALILDVDNTLIDYEKNFEDGTIEWAKNLKEKGIKLYILSNSNNEKKIKMVSDKLKVAYKHFGMKPLKKGFLKVQKILQEKPEHIAVVGDQIFTDVVGGNRCNMFTILVEPINEKDIFITKIKRPLEEYLKNKFRKKEEERDKNVL